jgi:hypothetical protein
MILVAGVLAVVAIPVLRLSRYTIPARLPARGRRPAVAPVLQLEPPSAESSLAVLDTRAA